MLRLTSVGFKWSLWSCFLTCVLLSHFSTPSARQLIIAVKVGHSCHWCTCQPVQWNRRFRTAPSLSKPFTGAKPAVWSWGDPRSLCLSGMTAFCYSLHSFLNKCSWFCVNSLQTPTNLKKICKKNQFLDSYALKLQQMLDSLPRLTFHPTELEWRWHPSKCKTK